MNKIFIEAKSKQDLNKDLLIAESKKLPKKIAIAYSIQFKDTAYKIKQILSLDHKINTLSQILGCSKLKFSKDTQAVLLIGSGRFHAIALAYESKLPVFIYEGEKITKISNEEILNLEKKRKALYIKFLNSKDVGVLISQKPGQERIKRALALKEKFKDKNFYFFLDNNIAPSNFENFGIKCFVNSACPRLDMDNDVLNINDL